ncbi:hypothetical protein [Burkholderia contaminans]|uniref:hypothetical protein n=1 Tax=Burkholderia contaminans TaxID=488447 RepID=UPI001589AC6A|nr:hypothetical protein [Burkholderia contaminans]
MQLEKPFDHYSKDEQIQLMFQALKEIKAERDYLEEGLENERNRANQATIAQHAFSGWNYTLWLFIFIAFILGYILRSL